MLFKNIPPVVARRIAKPTVRPATTVAKGIHVQLHVTEQFPHWISEGELAEALITIGDRTELTVVRFNVGYGDPITLLEREPELAIYPFELVLPAKKFLETELDIAFARFK